VMVDRIRSADAVPVVGLVTPFAHAPDRAVEFNTLLGAALERWGVAVIDFHAVTSDGRDWLPGMSDDGIHPNARGAEVMAAAAVPVIRAAY
ncbi:MAG: GDSL-like Lipase/Acylhydrolase family, partial [Actinomycetia bacterium]|nr:GDSL-like Lipase/Acylhydrolase family [Actinomycetes bacterium]